MATQGIISDFEKFDARRVLNQFLRSGLHVVLASGLHSAYYVDREELYKHTKDAFCLFKSMAEIFANDEVKFVLGPKENGVIPAFCVAHHLSVMNSTEVQPVFAKKTETDGFSLSPRDAKLIRGKRVLIADDILTTNGTIEKVMNLILSAGGILAGATVLWNASGLQAEDFGKIPKFGALIDQHLPACAKSECESCKKKIPFDTRYSKQLNGPSV